MLRQWHKLLAPFFAALLLLIGVTGMAIQVTGLLDTPAKLRPAPSGMANTGPASTGPASAITTKSAAGGKPKRTPMDEWNHWLKQLHSGEIVGGGGGVAINLLSGLALSFFAGSGFWMYYTMWQRRRRNCR